MTQFPTKGVLRGSLEGEPVALPSHHLHTAHRHSVCLGAQVTTLTYGVPLCPKWLRAQDIVNQLSQECPTEKELPFTDAPCMASLGVDWRGGRWAGAWLSKELSLWLCGLGVCLAQPQDQPGEKGRGPRSAGRAPATSSFPTSSWIGPSTAILNLLTMRNHGFWFCLQHCVELSTKSVPSLCPGQPSWRE